MAHRQELLLDTSQVLLHKNNTINTYIVAFSSRSRKVTVVFDVFSECNLGLLLAHVLNTL